MPQTSGNAADICLILEGTYPYVSGGVSTWTHEMINRHSHLTFHLLCILPPDAETEIKYQLPANVIGISHVWMQKLPGHRPAIGLDEILPEFEQPLLAITADHGTMEAYARLLQITQKHSNIIAESTLMDSESAFELIKRMYNQGYEDSSFLDYFWSWRSLMGSLFSIMMAPLPKANVYHTLSTGYAGMMAARAKIETGRPVVLTEHGIYTNERRIEVASAEWLETTASKSLTIDRLRNNLRDFWIQTFGSFSRICYEAADEIITLFEGNQRMQISDGARPEKLRIISNGVDIERFGAIQPQSHDRPTVALIGRVVPIKDIKSYIRAVSMLRDEIPEIRAYVLGPTEEDIEYYQECKQMVEYMGLQDTITFTGQVAVDKYLPQIDVSVLTSISEAMPLSVLEAGACGIPSVTTDVGACKEILYGRSDDTTGIGEGGIVVPLANPSAVAQAILRLLKNDSFYAECSSNIRKRVAALYNKDEQITAYRELYDHYLQSSSNRKVS
jgi:glycosyltransferase involved in cell wall biosynthesis